MDSYNLLAGAGRSIINLPEEIFPIEGFTGIHDELWARVLLLQNDSKMVILSLDLTSLPSTEIDTIKVLVSEWINTSIENVYVSVVHTFSAPHIRPDHLLITEEDRKKNQMLRYAIKDAVREAMFLATVSLSEAYVGFEYGFCSVNVNRDIYTEEGFWLGINKNGLSDKTLMVIRLEDKDRKPIAFLYNYGVQSSIMDGTKMSDGGKMVSADLVGTASRYVESKYEDKVTAIFCLGAAGDQAPALKARYMEVNSEGRMNEVDIQEGGFEIVRKLGEKLGTEVVKIAEKAVCKNNEINLSFGKRTFRCPGQQMPSDIRFIQPTDKYSYVADCDREVEIDVIGIGDIVLVGVSPELNCITAMELKAKSPFPKTLVLTMFNGACKYMPDKDSYRHITYESMNSPFASGSAELLCNQAIELLNEMKSKYAETVNCK